MHGLASFIHDMFNLLMSSYSSPLFTSFAILALVPNSTVYTAHISNGRLNCCQLKHPSYDFISCGYNFHSLWLRLKGTYIHYTPEPQYTLSH